MKKRLHHKKGNISGYMERNQQLIIGGLLVAILVLVAVTFMIGRNNPEDAVVPPSSTTQDVSRPVITPTPTGPIDQTVMVTFTGFIPESLTIKKGATVNFLNMSGDTIIIESTDGNPVMNLGQVSTNDEAVMTFENTGTYNYRNASMPEQVGTIIVQP